MKTGRLMIVGLILAASTAGAFRTAPRSTGLATPKLVYIGASHPQSIGSHPHDGETMAFTVWQAGGSAICPQKNTDRFAGVGGVTTGMLTAGDLAQLARCDGLYLIDGWESNADATAEHDFAVDHGIPILFDHNVQLSDEQAVVLVGEWIEGLEIRCLCGE